MESTITTSVGSSEWEIAPANTIAVILLFVLFIYLFFRHFMFVLMVMDVGIGWLRKFEWFPKEKRRLKALFHWMVANALFFGYLLVADKLGYLEFIPT